MLWSIAIIFALAWVIMLLAGPPLGGFVHLLLVVSVALVVAGAFKAGTKLTQRHSSDSERPTTHGTGKVAEPAVKPSVP